MQLDFDDVIKEVLSDKRSNSIPVLFIVQVLIILDDLGII